MCWAFMRSSGAAQTSAACPCLPEPVQTWLQPMFATCQHAHTVLVARSLRLDAGRAWQISPGSFKMLDVGQSCMHQDAHLAGEVAGVLVAERDQNIVACIWAQI